MNLTHRDRRLTVASLLWAVGAAGLAAYLLADSTPLLALSIGATALCIITTARAEP